MGAPGFIQGTSGEEISLIVDGAKIASVQNLSYKESQTKKAIRGAGFEKAHAMGRGIKEYTLEFEIKELNSAILSTPINALSSGDLNVTSVTVGGIAYSSMLDIPNMTILILYPVKNGIRKKKVFLGFEFDNIDGGFSLEDEAVTATCGGVALDAFGIL